MENRKRTVWFKMINKRTEPIQIGTTKSRLVFLTMLFGLCLVKGLYCPIEAVAAPVHYYFQRIQCSSSNKICTTDFTCDETSTPDGEANGNYNTYGWAWDDPIYHLDWTCDSAALWYQTNSCKNNSIQNDMYTPPFTKSAALSEMSVDIQASFHGIEGSSPLLQVKLYDTDPNAACPIFEGGTLIGSSAEVVWPNPSDVWGVINVPLPGVNYTMPAGHRIRIDVYINQGYERPIISINFGRNYQTQLIATQTPISSETTTVGSGIDPPDTTIGPGAPATDLDAFTLQTSAGTDSVSNATISLLPPGAFNNIETIAVTSDDNGITYGSVTGLSSDVVSIPLSTSITPTTEPVQYKVRITPRTHSGMSAPPGNSYDTQGRVTSIVSWNESIYNDTTSSIVAVDNLSPADPLWGIFAASYNQVDLVWTNPGDADFNEVIILKNTSSITDRPIEGAVYTQGDAIGTSTVIFAGSSTSFIDQEVSFGRTYHYKIFAADERLNYSAGSEIMVLTQGNPVWGDITAGDRQIALAWDNPTFPNFDGTLILRSESPISDAPEDGMTYAQGNVIGAAEVIFAGGPSQSQYVDVGLTNGADYYYKMFSMDSTANKYSEGVSAGPYQPDPVITVGDGINPPDAVIPPGNPPLPVDSFTLQSSSGTNEVNGVTISFAPGSAASMNYLELINDSGSVVYGAAYPADTVTIPATARIPVTTTPVQYKIRITPKGRAPIMPWPWSWTGGRTYDISFTVQTISTTTPANVIYADSSSASVIIDNLAPLNPSWGTVTPGDKQIALNWTNPADTDFAEVLIVDHCVNPAQGATYVPGDQIGSGTVKYIGISESYLDTGLTNGSNYIYAIFSKDAYGNYSNGSCIGPFVPLPVVIVGDDANPGNLSLSPGGPPSFLDSFTLSMSSGSQSVTDLTVTLAPGTAEALSLIEITNEDGSSVYGSVSNPSSDTIAISLAPFISVTVSPAQYRVRVTPKSHSAMPPPPGSYYNMTGEITALTATASSIKAYNDSSSSVISIDNASPDNPVWGSLEPGERQITLNWTNPTDADFSRLIILRNAAAITVKPVEGHTYYKGDTIGGSRVVFADMGQNFNDTGLSGSVTYYYKIFAMDTSGNYSTGTESTPSQPIVVNSTTPTTVTAVSGLRSIIVSTPYFNDDNLNNSCQLDYKLGSDTSWTPWSTSSCDGEKSIQDLSDNTYDIRVTYQDPDGVVGIAEQIINSVKPQSEKLIHNSRTTGSFYWAPLGWGIAGGMYGEFTCETCHMKNSPNISRIKDMIELEGLPPRPVIFYSKTGPESYGDDTEPRFAPMTSRICEVCHTMTSGLQNTPMDPPLFGPIHQYEQPEPANHYNANGTDNCLCCHTHETGFAIPQFFNPDCSP